MNQNDVYVGLKTTIIIYALGKFIKINQKAIQKSHEIRTKNDTKNDTKSDTKNDTKG